MLRHLLPLFFIGALSANAQVEQPPIPVQESPTRPVLKAMPIGGDEDVAANPTPQTTGAMPTEAAPAVAPLDTKPMGEEGVRLQIFLDESNFGPGVIDGKPGRFTELAVQSWNEVNGFPLGDWVAVNTAARKAVHNPYAVAVVPDAVKDWVDPTLPTKHSLQALRKRMSYRSNAEFMAERYHTTEDYLISLNGKSKIYDLKAKDSILVPNVNPFHIERITGASYKAEDPLSQRHAVVDTKINQVRIFEAAPVALVVAEDGSISPAKANRGLIASFPITPGEERFIHYGNWAVKNMVEMPHWRYDPKLLDTGVRGKESLNIPPGPNCPVGIIWNGLTKSGIGLHGTSDPETIGRARSHGCIRLANWDAIRLPNLIRPGTTVEVR